MFLTNRFSLRIRGPSRASMRSGTKQIRLVSISTFSGTVLKAGASTPTKSRSTGKTSCQVYEILFLLNRHRVMIQTTESSKTAESPSLQSPYRSSNSLALMPYRIPLQRSEGPYQGSQISSNFSGNIGSSTVLALRGEQSKLIKEYNGGVGEEARRISNVSAGQFSSDIYNNNKDSDSREQLPDDIAVDLGYQVESD